MRTRQLERERQTLLALFGKAGQLGANFELQSHWARYLCVLSAGFLENAIKLVYADYARNCAAPNAAAFIAANLAKIQNPKRERFLKVAREFNRVWEDELSTFMEEDGRGEAIDSIMSNRHNIAHGQRSSITLSQLRNYLEKAICVLEFLERLCAR